MKKKTKNNHFKLILLLHVLLMIYSLSTIFSKKVGEYSFLSIEFCFMFGGIILILGIYAICWQQIIKRLPLTIAFANKAITVVWGIVWGYIFFNESITLGKIVGAVLVISGVVLFALGEADNG